MTKLVCTLLAKTEYKYTCFHLFNLCSSDMITSMTRKQIGDSFNHFILIITNLLHIVKFTKMNNAM